MKRKTTLLLASIALASLAAPSFAEDEYNVSTGFSLEGTPLALRGVDTVALSTLNAVAQGDAAHVVEHDGVAYYFASEITAEKFTADPEAYIPQYGGFCAFAVAIGKKLDGDPRYADIVDGKLYLFVNAAVFAKYKENPEETLRKAEETWPSIQHAAAGSL
ncbi:YHS domain-containing (seleno)protein [Tropicimonas sediminicola]|uniref:YHS domain-containing protein n=1 Tax=Tropicimonas sediminicola TaxID=1031541 RepID=A0A239FSQ1_9RHOB|nr:YHS domain-containing (seleno)protein [Tropicimonas sediminicola]SNS58884.1 YHS domain-containing protein [Tropicimonas sediminicola]